jgi:hypothetical protein
MISGLSATGLAVIRKPHAIFCTCDVYRSHQLIAKDIPISGGSVYADRTQNARRTCTVSIPDRSYIPVFSNDPLAPYGTELVIKYGIKGPKMSTIEWVQLGVFVIVSAHWNEPTGEIEVAGTDRTIRLLDAFGLPKLFINYTANPAVYAEAHRLGTVNLHAFINELVTHRAGGHVSITYDSHLPQPASTRSPKGLIMTDRWETGIVAAAKLLGGEPYFDHLGQFHIDVLPAVTDTPVYTVNAGPTGVLVSASRGLTRERVYNMCTVRSAVTGSYAHATVYDNDPTSPTYPGVYTHIPGRAADVTTGAAAGYQAAFGEIHKVIDSMVSATTAQCEREARTWLHAQLGLLRSVDFVAPVHILEPGDVVSLVYQTGGHSEKHLIENMTVPLGTDTGWSFTTRTDNYIVPGG